MQSDEPTERPARPRAALHTIGCRLNQAETALLAERLEHEGYELVSFGEPTDLLVLNTCSVTEQAEADCRYAVRRTLRQSPEAFVAVTGCYAQSGADQLRRMPGIDLLLGTQYKMDLPKYLPAPGALRKRPSPEVLHSRTIDREDFMISGTGDYDTARAMVKVQDGCNAMCAFCIIPFTRGHERSRVFDDVVREAEDLAARGHRELVLTGVNIGQYRHDGAALLDVIQRLERIAGVDRIRISSIEPTTVPDELIEYMATSRKLCHYLHIPLQSGDDGILTAMNRRYSVSDYRALIERAIRLVPDLGLGTDLMVGFPGEDDRAFANTLAVARDLPFDYFHVFSFSTRPGTAAARLRGRVPPALIRARARTLTELSRAKRLASYRRLIGTTCSVLFETQDECGRWTGLTGAYMRVGVTSGEPLRNQSREVLVTGAMDGLTVGEVSVKRRKPLPLLTLSGAAQ